MAELYDTKDIEETFVLIGVEQDTNKILMRVSDSLDELEELVNSTDGKVIGRMIQKRESINKAHYFGKGKIEELRLYANELGATGIICDDELSPSQLRNMNKMLGLKVLTRTLVILDIFAKRATTAEGKVQVELAQLKYKLTHLVGEGKSLSRLGGGIGTKGPGEKKLETDRRNIANRISELNSELKQIENHRKIVREKRLKNKIPTVALIGYTNAGKSTLLNTITKSDVLAMDKLFATLDTTTRKIKLESGREYLFIDTVGFIQKLPHTLIKSFKSTLEEIKYADILLNIVDCSSSIIEEQNEIVYKTLQDLDCEKKPIITVFNKIDKKPENKIMINPKFSIESLEISGKNGIGIENMLQKVEEIIKSFKTPISILIPYEKSYLVNQIHGRCEILETENRETGTYFKIYVDEEMNSKLKEFILN